MPEEDTKAIPILRFDPERIRNPDVAGTFKQQYEENLHHSSVWQ
ncbi:MAG: hypothetical protein AB2693_02960 [Candidatus Thiodiazotropha sp.]